MRLQGYSKAEKTDFRRDFQESTVNCKFNLGNKLARGARRALLATMEKNGIIESFLTLAKIIVN